MYTNFKLEQNPYFKMKGGDFNALVNSLCKEKITDEHLNAKLGLVIRTMTTNLVATTEDGNKLFEKDLDSNLGEGFFNVISNVQMLLLDTFEEIDFDTIKNTVLLPYGAFEDEGEIIIYVNLIIDDNLVDKFSTNPSIKFLPIEEDSLNMPNKRNIIILPTLTIVSNE